MVIIHQSILIEADDDDGFASIKVPSEGKDCLILLSDFQNVGLAPR